jgi:hypothetical protein
MWTPLPNRFIAPLTRHVLLSVYMAPRLESKVASPTLSLFPDWENWPRTLMAGPGGPLEFEVTFSGYPPVTVKPVPLSSTPKRASSPSPASAVMTTSTSRPTRT